MFLIELLSMSIIILVMLIAGVACVITASLVVIMLCAKVIDWSEKFGCWVEWVAILALLWLAAFVLSICSRI